jgi:hypothetical protein
MKVLKKALKIVLFFLAVAALVTGFVFMFKNSPKPATDKVIVFAPVGALILVSFLLAMRKRKTKRLQLDNQKPAPRRPTVRRFPNYQRQELCGNLPDLAGDKLRRVMARR